MNTNDNGTNQENDMELEISKQQEIMQAADNARQANQVAKKAEAEAKRAAKKMEKEVSRKAMMKAIIVALKPLLIGLLIILLVSSIASSILNYITFWDGTVQEGEDSNIPYLVEQYSNDTEIVGREITNNITAKEIWDKSLNNSSRIKEYLDKPEELLKLINAELCTSFLDTRENPDAPINWKKLNKDVNSNVIQGLVKLKRARETGEYITMVYADPATFQGWIDAYNATGDEGAKNNALNHFTLEKGYIEEGIEGPSVGYNGSGSSSSNESSIHNYPAGPGAGPGTGELITSEQAQEYINQAENGKITAEKGKVYELDDGTKIVIPPEGMGKKKLYNYWQTIGSWTQKDLIDAAGMNFDEEGFGTINGRYAVAVTQTYCNVGTGKVNGVGDYIDFYLENGEVIPAIVVDIKSLRPNSSTSEGNNTWGSQQGENIIEFYVDQNTWTGHVNPGTNDFHMEWTWDSPVIMTVTGGNYFKDPNFGRQNIMNNNEDSTTSKKITSTEQIASMDKLVIGMTKVADTNNSEGDSIRAMCWPTDSTNVTSPFGPRKAPTEGASTNHGGIDIAAAYGGNVYAAEDGVVIGAANAGSAGNMVTIDHGNGYITKYMHNSSLNVKQGDKVTKGQVIAFAGSTGVSKGTHLHFQIEYNGTKIDPLRFDYENGMGGNSSSNPAESSGSGISGGIGSNMDAAIHNYETGNYPSDLGYDYLEENGKYYAKIAVWEETTETLTSNEPGVASYGPNTSYQMTTANINYEQIVKGYTMPFEFLWDFLLVGQQKEFVLELADLVFESKVEISVLDCIRENTSVSTYTYTEHLDVDTYDVNLYVTQTTATGEFLSGYPVGPLSGSGTAENKYTTVNTSVTKTNTIDVILSKADVWIVDYEQGYITQTGTSTGESNTPHEPKEYSPVTDNSDPAGIAAGFAASYSSSGTDIITDAEVRSVTSTWKRTDIDRNTHVTTTTYYLNNLATPPNIEEKTDKDSSEPNFVNIFRKKKYNKNAQNVYSAPRWIFQMFEENESTADMVDLTKYLLYKSTDKMYDEVDYFDWSLFYISDFKAIGSSYGHRRRWRKRICWFYQVCIKWY